MACFVLGCSCAGARQDAPHTPPAITYEGSAPWTGTDRPLPNTRHLETSATVEGGTTTLYCGFLTARTSTAPEATPWGEPETLATGAELPYVFQAQGATYCAAKSGAAIYLWKRYPSGWAQVNFGRPILTPGPGVWTQVWNVAVAEGPDGTLHLLAECGTEDDFAHVGLGYSSAQMVDDQVDFNPGRSASHVLPHAGNPWLQWIPERSAWLAVYGFRQSSNVWDIRAATGDTPGAMVPSTTFRVSVPGVHICDPSLVQLPSGHTMLTFSVDQLWIYEAFSEQSIPGLFDALR